MCLSVWGFSLCNTKGETLGETNIWILIYLPILLGKITQALSDWKEDAGEQQCSSLVTDSQLDGEFQHSPVLDFEPLQSSFGSMLKVSCPVES